MGKFLLLTTICAILAVVLCNAQMQKDPMPSPQGGGGKHPPGRMLHGNFMRLAAQQGMGQQGPGPHGPPGPGGRPGGPIPPMGGPQASAGGQAHAADAK